MIEPHLVAEAVQNKIITNISQFAFTDDNGTKQIAAGDVKIIADLPSNNKYGMKPPWCGVYYNIDEDGEVLASGNFHKLPIIIGALFSSSRGYKTDVEALRESMYYAKVSIPIIIGEYQINIGTTEEPEIVFVDLECRPQPIKIVPGVSAELAMVTSWFQYLERC